MSDLQIFSSSKMISPLGQNSDQQDLVLHSLVWWEALSVKWKHILLMNLDINERFAHNVDLFYNNHWGIRSLEQFYQNVFDKEPISVDKVDSELIKKIKSIKILVAGGMHISDTEPVNELKDLEYCSLYVNDIEVFKVKELPKLRYLDLGQNKLKGKLNFSGFPELRRLDVEENYNITMLEINNLSKLHTLWCFENQLQSIEIDRVEWELFVKCSNIDEFPLQIITQTPERVASNCYVMFKS